MGKDNKTLVAKCAACEKEIAAVTAVGLTIRRQGRRKIVPTCRACYEKGWRPPDYAGF